MYVCIYIFIWIISAFSLAIKITENVEIPDGNNKNNNNNIKDES